jgi:hypothetical protein
VIAAATTVLVRAAEEEFDPDTVTPGVWGFVLTFLVMAAVVLLVLDMVRRIRRVNYRAEVREQLEAERLEEELLAGGSDLDPLDDLDDPDAPGRTPRTDGRPAASDDDDLPPTR